MHLKSLTLKGFKSFASATTLKFEPGICAVVGPNGSGKSNVVDALAWVMGEQGAKTLRGGKMQDVIFAGASDRKPLGRAEVTLTIDNSDGTLPIDYSEVSITRRMFRDGAGEYEINGARARLMDIQELLSDSGIGREMHVIVGQGRLAQILESRPEERRSFIEEAAGVLKHRRRKEKAQRKLVGMQVNLDRLTDLVDELKRQLKPLERQAKAAQRAGTVQATLRDARLRLAGARVQRLYAEFDDVNRRASLLAEQVDEVKATLVEAEEVQWGLEVQLEKIAPQAETAQQLWFSLSTLAERISATSRIAAERATGVEAGVRYRGPDPDHLDDRAEQAEFEFTELTLAVEVAVERLDSIREEAFEREEARREADAEHVAQMRSIADRREGTVRLLASEDSLAHQVSAAKEELVRQAEAVTEMTSRTRAAERDSKEIDARIAELAQQRGPLEEAYLSAGSESDAAEKRLEQLRGAQRDCERVVYSLQSKIDTLRQNLPTTLATDALTEWNKLAELVHARKGVRRALSAALGAHAEAFAGELSEELIEEVAGSTRTVLVDVHSSATWRIDATLPESVTWLLDEVSVDSQVSTAINRLLADVALAPDLSTARSLVADDPRLRAVTPEGVLCGQGWVELGASVEVTVQIAEAETGLIDARSELDSLSGTFEGARIAADESRVDAAAKRAALREHDQSVLVWNRDSERLAKQYEANAGEHRRAIERVTSAESRLGVLREKLDEARERLARADNIDTPEEPSTRARDEAASSLAQVKAMEMEANLTLRTAEERASQAEGKGEALRRQAQQERLAKTRHDEVMRRRREAAELAKTVEKHAHNLGIRVVDAAARAAISRDQLLQQRAGVAGKLSGVRDTVNAAREQLDRLTNTAHSGEIAKSQAQVRIDEAEAKIVEQLGLPIADLLADYAPAEGFNQGEEEKRLKQAEKDLTALGKVNPLALEEFKALEERYTFLSTQLDDVVRARTDLSGVIDEVDAQILQLFTDAWHDVEAQFPQVFSTLFPGGEGRLILTDPDDLLTTGIDVEARPPGKRVKRLSLLSGGEKSLTALAMLVAIFKARPSPFYVMDEVEASLDDVNLRRLIALFEELRKDSQLIVITHQKPTMDVANVLYGVTMRGDGVTRVISQRMSASGYTDPFVTPGDNEPPNE